MKYHTLHNPITYEMMAKGKPECTMYFVLFTCRLYIFVLLASGQQMQISILATLTCYILCFYTDIH